MQNKKQGKGRSKDSQAHNEIDNDQSQVGKGGKGSDQTEDNPHFAS